MDYSEEIDTYTHVKGESDDEDTSLYDYNTNTSIYTDQKAQTSVPSLKSEYKQEQYESDSIMSTPSQVVDTQQGQESESSSITARRSSRLIGKTQPKKSKYIEPEDDIDEIEEEKGTVEVDDNNKYLISIDRILDDRETKEGQIEYLVKYRNLSYLHLNWETEDFIIDNRKRWKYSIMKYETNKQKNEIEALENSKIQYDSESDLDISTTSTNYEKYQCVDKILLHKKCTLEINKDTYLIGWRVLQDYEETTAKQLIKYSPNRRYFKLNLDEFEELVKISEERGVKDVIPTLLKMNPDIDISEPEEEEEEEEEEDNNEVEEEESSDDDELITFGNKKKYNRSKNKKKKQKKKKNKPIKKENDNLNDQQQQQQGDMINYTLSNTNEDIFDDIDMDKEVKDSIFIEETLYLCKWKGLDYELATWERAADFKDNVKIRAYFELNTVPPEIANSDISDFIGKDDLLFLDADYINDTSNGNGNNNSNNSDDEDYKNPVPFCVPGGIGEKRTQIWVPPNLKGAWRKALYNCMLTHGIRQIDVCTATKLSQCALSTWLHSKYMSFPKTILPKLGKYMQQNFPDICKKAVKEYFEHPEDDVGPPIPTDSNNNDVKIQNVVNTANIIPVYKGSVDEGMKVIKPGNKSDSAVVKEEEEDDEDDERISIKKEVVEKEKQKMNNSIPLSSNYRTTLFKNLSSNIKSSSSSISPVCSPIVPSSFKPSSLIPSSTESSSSSSSTTKVKSVTTTTNNNNNNNNNIIKKNSYNPQTKSIYSSTSSSSLQEQQRQQQQLLNSNIVVSTTYSNGRLRKKPFIKYQKSITYKNGNELRDYQVDGLNWLIDRWMNNINAILADEMGLGKTAQVISMLEHLHRYESMRGPFLIVGPLSIIKHWKREIENWTDFRTCVYHGSSNIRNLIRLYEWFYPNFRQDVLKFDILITTYDILISDAQILSKIHWKYLVLDEAHRLRNTKSKTFQKLQMFTYDYVLLLTGTPFQNNVEELWSLLHFIQAVGNEDKFMEEFGNLRDAKQVENLQKKMENCLLRRIKEDVEKSIPEMIETIIDVELTILQKQYYRAIYDKNRSFLYRGCNKASLPSLINIEMELRKCCNHPFLIKGGRERELNNIIIEKENDLNNNEKGENNKDNQDDEDKKEIIVTESEMMQHIIDCSGKMVLINKLLPKLKSDNHKVLIFSQMVKMLDLLEEYCLNKKYPYERIDGGIKGDDRQAAIDRFCNSSRSFIFLLSTRAGGLGINLTAADTVIIYDSDWNPQNDCQATARCHRIGQTNEVKVYRLITRKTYEAEMFEKASMKLGLEQALFSGSEDGNRPKLSKTDMENLLRKGAYGCLEGDDQDNKIFYQADIEQILKNNTREVKVTTGVKGTRFSKTTFVSEEQNAKISVTDPKFWEKVLPNAQTPEHFKSILESGQGFKNAEKKAEFTNELCNLAEQYYFEKNSGYDFADNDWENLCNVLLDASTMKDIFSKKECKLFDEKLRDLESLTFKRKRCSRNYNFTNEDGTINSGISGYNNNGNIVVGRHAKDKLLAMKDLDPWDLPICCICDKDGDLIVCKGRCQRLYHPECLGLTKETALNYKCDDCKNEVYECQICHKKDKQDKNAEHKVILCAQSLCNKFYHLECVKDHPYTHFIPSKKRYFCPAHYCRKCGLTSGDGELVQCCKCIKAYHTLCQDWNLAIRLKRKIMICSDHVTPDEVAEYNATHVPITKHHVRGRPIKNTILKSNNTNNNIINDDDDNMIINKKRITNNGIIYIANRNKDNNNSSSRRKVNGFIDNSYDVDVNDDGDDEYKEEGYDDDDDEDNKRIIFGGVNDKKSVIYNDANNGVKKRKLNNKGVRMRNNYDKRYEAIISDILQEDVNDCKCRFCHLKGETDELHIIRHKFSYKNKEFAVHEECALSCAEVVCNDPYYSNIVAALKRTKRNLCSICNNNHASLLCKKRGCDKLFHIPCLKEVDLVYNPIKIFYCQKHCKKTVTPSAMNNNNNLNINNKKKYFRNNEVSNTISPSPPSFSNNNNNSYSQKNNRSEMKKDNYSPNTTKSYKNTKENKTVENEGTGLCVCGKTEDSPSFTWVQCVLCHTWYHPECVGLIGTDLELIKDYYCPFCISKAKTICTCIPKVTPADIKNYYECSKCDKLYHKVCLANPPPDVYDITDWCCEKCIKEKSNIWNYRCSDCYYRGISSVECRNKKKHEYDPWYKKEGPTCCVCGVSKELYPDIPIFECKECHLFVHEQCIGEKINTEEDDTNGTINTNWVCNVCTIFKSNADKVLCEICGRNGGAMKRTETGNYCHIVCALWIDECTFGDVENLEPINGISTISEWRYKCKCSECLKNDHCPCIKCTYPDCDNTFHPLCGRKAGLYMITNQSEEGSVEMVSYCAYHSYITIGFCDVCKKNDCWDNSNILICSGCNKVIHTYCLTYEYHENEKGWFCEDCENNNVNISEEYNDDDQQNVGGENEEVQQQETQEIETEPQGTQEIETEEQTQEIETQEIETQEYEQQPTEEDEGETEEQTQEIETQEEVQEEYEQQEPTEEEEAEEAEAQQQEIETSEEIDTSENNNEIQEVEEEEEGGRGRKRYEYEGGGEGEGEEGGDGDDNINVCDDVDDGTEIL